MPGACAATRARLGSPGDAGGGALSAEADRVVHRGDPPAQPVQEGRGVGRAVAASTPGVRQAPEWPGPAGSGGAGRRDAVGAFAEALGRVVHVPEPPRGRADQLGGGASDPAGGGEPKGVGREPHLGGCSRPGSVDVRAGDMQASRAFWPGVRQPDPARLRQSPAPAPYSPPPPLIKSSRTATMSYSKAVLITTRPTPTSSSMPTTSRTS